jgi:hypothetical protein
MPMNWKSGQLKVKFDEYMSFNVWQNLSHRIDASGEYNYHITVLGDKIKFNMQMFVLRSTYSTQSLLSINRRTIVVQM